MNSKRIKVKVKSAEQSSSEAVRQLFIDSLNTFLDEAGHTMKDSEKREIISELMELSNDTLIGTVDTIVDTYMCGYDLAEDDEGEEEVEVENE